MPVRSQRFAARWSLSVWIVTCAVTLLVVIVVAGMIRMTVNAVPDDGDGSRALLVVAAFVPPVILCVTIFFAPLGYTVQPQIIEVNRMGPNVAIPCEHIADVRRLRRTDLGFTLRIFGSGGFFGAFGRFYSYRLRWFRAYITDHQDLVLITRTDGTKILISPHPVDAFLDALDRAREHSA